MQDALVINEFMARTADVIEDLVAASLGQCCANTSSEIVEYFVPGHSLPFACATLTDALERIKNALRIIHLVECRGTLGAIAPAAARMGRIALELADAAGLLIDIGE